MNSIQNYQQLSVADIEETQKVTNALMKSKHYQKLGQEGIFAVVQMSKALNIDPIHGLNGGLYYIQGKIEMKGDMMMSLIRQAGHSVTKDKRSNEQICILHGRRADTGDTWTESFSLDDACKAGVISNGVYKKYGRIMLQWRALSTLARFLFPDVIKGCYVESEISMSPPLNAPVDIEQEKELLAEIQVEALPIKVEITTIDENQLQFLTALVSQDAALKNRMMSYLDKQFGVKDLKDLPAEQYGIIKAKLESHLRQKESAA